MFKPKLFIGSSSEARGLAHDFADALSNEAITVVWDEAPDFEPTKATLTGLVTATETYDFGLFLLTPDDTLESRGKKGMSARDNVFLELGLFLGALGPDRTFAVVQAKDNGEPSVKATSDLAGIKIPRFKKSTDEHERVSIVRTAVRSIKKKIDKLGIRSVDLRRYGFGFSVAEKFLDFRIPKEEIQRLSLAGKSFMVVARKHAPDKDFSEDSRTAKSQPREISAFLTDSFQIKAEMERIRIDDLIEGYLLMTPVSMNLKDLRNLTYGELLKRGCKPVVKIETKASA
jgi:hypothetical protein